MAKIGSKHIQRPEYGILKSIRAKPENYQLLCANCNWIKRYENDEIHKYHE